MINNCNKDINKKSYIFKRKVKLADAKYSKLADKEVYNISNLNKSIITNIQNFAKLYSDPSFDNIEINTELIKRSNKILKIKKRLNYIRDTTLSLDFNIVEESPNYDNIQN